MQYGARSKQPLFCRACLLCNTPLISWWWDSRKESSPKEGYRVEEIHLRHSIVSSQLILRMFANMTITTDMAERLQTTFHLIIMTQMVSRKDLTPAALALETDSEDKIHEMKTEAAFEATGVTSSAPHARKADSNLETDTTWNNEYPHTNSSLRYSSKYRMWKLSTYIGRP